MARIALEEMLKKKRVSKREFAKRLGMAYHNVFRLFRDGGDPKFSTLEKWARVLNCRVRDLIKE